MNLYSFVAVVVAAAVWAKVGHNPVQIVCTIRMQPLDWAQMSVVVFGLESNVWLKIVEK